LSAGTNNYLTIAEWFKHLEELSHQQCDMCGYKLRLLTKFCKIPDMLAIEFAEGQIGIDTSICLCKDDTAFKFVLAGIIYYGSNHFTCR